MQFVFSYLVHFKVISNLRDHRYIYSTFSTKNMCISVLIVVIVAQRQNICTLRTKR